MTQSTTGTLPLTLLLSLLVLAGVSGALPSRAAAQPAAAATDTMASDSMATDSKVAGSNIAATNIAETSVAETIFAETIVTETSVTETKAKTALQAAKAPLNNSPAPGSASAAGNAPPATFVPSAEIDTDKAVDFPANI
jgi:hypothetical protein